MENALAWLKERNVAPTPAHFELGYAYVSDENADLRHRLDLLASTGLKIGAEVLDNLYRLYVRSGVKNEAIAEVSESIFRRARFGRESAQDVFGRPFGLWPNSHAGQRRA